MVLYPGASGMCLENLLNLILKYLFGMFGHLEFASHILFPPGVGLSGNNFSASYEASELCWQIEIAPCSLQGCIFRLTCSHHELTKDHVLTNANVKIL